jgi:hypothetical protein
MMLMGLSLVAEDELLLDPHPKSARLDNPRTALRTVILPALFILTPDSCLSATAMPDVT